MKRILLITTLAIAGSLVYAQDLESYFQGALEKDRNLAILKEQLEILTIQEEINDLPGGFSFTSSSSPGQSGGGLLSVVVKGEGDVTVSGKSSFNYDFQDSIGTNFSLDLPYDFGSSGAWGLELSPVIGVSQSLDPLFGINRDDLKDYSRFVDREKAGVDITDRKTQVELIVVSSLLNIIKLEQEKGKTALDLETAVDELGKARSLGTWEEGSVHLERLQLSVNRLANSLYYAEGELEREIAEFEELTGVAFGGVPGIPEPDAIETGGFLDNYIAALETEESAGELYRLENPLPPEIVVGGTYGFRISGEPSPVEFLGVSLSILGEEYSVSSNVEYSFVSEELVLSASISWDPKGSKRESLDLREQEAQLRISTLKYQMAEDTADDSYEDYLTDLSEKQALEILVAMEHELAQRELSITKERWSQGLSSAKELREAEWEVQDLLLEEQSLKLQIFQIILSINALFIEGENG